MARRRQNPDRAQPVKPFHLATHTRLDVEGDRITPRRMSRCAVAFSEVPSVLRRPEQLRWPRVGAVDEPSHSCPGYKESDHEECH